LSNVNNTSQSQFLRPSASLIRFFQGITHTAIKSQLAPFNSHPLSGLDMAGLFDDRHTQIEAENAPYHQYQYQTEENGSWAGALPVKQ
jgi:hypothetical protein